jgi:heat shock protein HslJ
MRMPRITGFCEYSLRVIRKLPAHGVDIESSYDYTIFQFGPFSPSIVPSIIIAVLIIAGVFLTACTSEEPSGGLNGSSWKLASYGPVGKQTPAAAGTQTSLDFGKDGQVSGKLGCNGFSGNYVVIGNKFVFASMISSMMACAEPLMTQEGTVFHVLNGMVRFEIEETTLRIYDTNGASAITLSR